jgi:hypothetical protein
MVIERTWSISYSAAFALFCTGNRLIARDAHYPSSRFGALLPYWGVGGINLAGTAGLLTGVVYLTGNRNLWAHILLHGLNRHHDPKGRHFRCL